MSCKLHLYHNMETMYTHILSVDSSFGLREAIILNLQYIFLHNIQTLNNVTFRHSALIMQFQLHTKFLTVQLTEAQTPKICL